jgi:flagellar basal-body rod protein FlgB
MFGSWISGSTIPLLEQVAAFGERRQQVLAGNIANIDTPGYRARDLPVADFQEALAARVQASRQPHTSDSVTSPAGTSPNLAANTPLPRELFLAGERAPVNLTSHDANNRSVEHELSEMTKNAMLQTYSVQIMTTQMNLLGAIISERP